MARSLDWTKTCRYLVDLNLYVCLWAYVCVCVSVCVCCFFGFIFSVVIMVVGEEGGRKEHHGIKKYCMYVCMNVCIMYERVCIYVFAYVFFLLVFNL